MKRKTTINKQADAKKQQTTNTTKPQIVRGAERRKKQMSKTHKKAETFVQVWCELAPTQGSDAVAERLEIAKTAVTSRAANYRKHGVELPRAKTMGNKGPKIDYAVLSALVG